MPKIIQNDTKTYAPNVETIEKYNDNSRLSICERIS